MGAGPPSAPGVPRTSLPPPVEPSILYSSRPALPRRAGRAVARGLDSMFSTGGRGFRILALAHASSTAGDTLVAIALANSLFFAVPSSEARGNVALYLLLTVAPFAVIGPLLGRLLDRHGPGRTGLVVSAAGRAVAAALLVWQQATFWLFPLAFGLLVLSRAHGIGRSALLPVALDSPVALVSANARLARITVLAGAVVAPLGAGGAALAGPSAPLIMASAAFVLSALQSVRLPVDVEPDEADLEERRAARAPMVRLPRHVRLAQVATAVVRLLNGFLVLLLAFSLRRRDAPLLDFGAILAAAGGGYGLSAVLAPGLEQRLREEPMVVAALALEAAAAFAAAQWFGLAAAAALALAAGFAWGTAKFAFDGLLQATVPPGHRGRAFTRSETLFQLAWVTGAVVPTALLLPADVGLVLAGFAALAVQTIYVSRLLGSMRAAS